MNTGTIIGTDFDPNAANNLARLTLSVPNPAGEEELPEVPANLPVYGAATMPAVPNIEERMDLDPDTPTSPNTGSGNTGGSNEPSKTSQPNDNSPLTPSEPLSRLGQDVLTVRGTVSAETTPDAGKLSGEPDKNNWKDIGDILNEVFGSPDLDILVAIALLAYITSFLLSAGVGLLFGWTIAGIIAGSFLVYAAILFVITMLILLWALYKLYSRPKS